ILFLNPVAEKTFGASAEKLVGQNLATLLPGNTYQAHLVEIRDHLDTRRTPVALQLPGRTLHGAQILLEMSLGTISARGKNLFTAILRDITNTSGSSERLSQQTNS